MVIVPHDKKEEMVNKLVKVHNKMGHNTKLLLRPLHFSDL